MLLHNTVIWTTTFLLCLSSSGTAEQALHSGTEVQESLDGQTRPPQQDGLAGVNVAVHLPITTQELPNNYRLATRDTSTRDKGRVEPAASVLHGNKGSLQSSNILRNNTTGEAAGESDGTVRTDRKNGKQEKVAQPVTDNSGTPGWLTDTLNVTITPKVNWTRNAAPRRNSSPTKENESPEKRGERDEDEEEDILLTVTFIKEGQPLVLDLHPNRDLLTAAYTESSGDEAAGDDTLPKETREPPCEYQGVVRGVTKAWVALSVCGGLRGMVSVTLEEEQQVDLLIEPSPGSNSSRDPHRVFSAALLHQDGVCGVKDSRSTVKAEKDAKDSYPAAERSANSSSSSARRARRWAELRSQALWHQKDTRFVELVLVADNSFFRIHGDQTRSLCKTLINIVNALYRPLGVVVVLSHLEVWEHGDKIRVTEDFQENLKLLAEYRMKMLEKKPDYNNDNTMLLTTVDFMGSTVGYAYVSGMCSNTNSAGVVQSKPHNEVGVTAYTLAHEMGHNFGMKHDDECTAPSCHGTSCIMSGSSSNKFNVRVSWSSCSRQVIEDNLNSMNYKCLRNVPTRMYQISSCGDGVVDSGEQCDCGPKEFCNNPCCVADTCKFAVNASCASGPCCDTETCQPKPGGTVCRVPFTECDLPEFCSGDSELCPEDVTKADGTPCHREQGYCYKATCASHEDQCHTVWGQSARMADPICYSKLNTRGGTNGNCGYKDQSNTDELLPCADRDKLCGTVQCLTEQGTEPRKIGQAFNYGTQSFGPSYTAIHCSYIVSSRKLPSRFWLSPDGTKCGKNMMCLKQKCVRVPEPAGHCRSGCSGRGVCNSRNHCHCDPGFAPPDCSKKGLGGSIDSNQIGRNRYKDPSLEALFFLFLILLGIFIVICCLWSHIHRWWEKSGRGKVCSCCAHCLDICCCSPMSLITDRLFGKKKKKDVSKEAQNEYERDRMICQVDLDLKDKEPKTNSWGVASEMLVTEVTTTTPKNSPDYRRKVFLPSHPSGRQPTTTEIPNHPTYTHSISVDSGCVSDADDTTVGDHFGSQMLKRLLQAVGSRSPSSPPKEEDAPPKTYERQQSMPLSRYVVDPLAGSRRSRQGTPPPEHVKQGWGRSISVDEKINPSACPGSKPPPPQPPKAKSPKGISSLTQTCLSTKQSGSTSRNGRADDNGRGTPILEDKNPLRPAQVAPVSAEHSASPSPASKAWKAMMPPQRKVLTSVSKNTQSSNESSQTNNSSSKSTQIVVKSSPNLPVLPPGKGSSKHSGVVSCGSSTQQTIGNQPRPPKTGGRVRDLAKKLEKQ